MLLWKIKDAVPAAGDHTYQFRQLTESVEPKSIAEWRAAVEEWEKDKTKANPFEVKVSSMYPISRRPFAIYGTRASYCRIDTACRSSRTC
jgi:hypothetical protein